MRALKIFLLHQKTSEVVTSKVVTSEVKTSENWFGQHIQAYSLKVSYDQLQ